MCFYKLKCCISSLPIAVIQEHDIIGTAIQKFHDSTNHGKSQIQTMHYVRLIQWRHSQFSQKLGNIMKVRYRSN